MPVHFWTPEEPPETLDGWDPDVEPHLHADGFGHNMLELYTRMHKGGYEVSLGTDIPANSRVVVFLPSLLNRRAQVRLFAELLRRRWVDLVSVRSDFLISYQLPVPPTLEVMPNRASISLARQEWIPPLPQRGLLPRSHGRGAAMDTLGYKGYPENLPEPMQHPGWAERLRSIGVAWQPDVRDEATGVNSWHDFSTLDVAVCLRVDGAAVGLLRKPATKLINAWCAGVIPFVGREPSYLELASHREDAMVVESADDVVVTLQELRSDQRLVERLRSGVAARGRQFTTARVLSLWTGALTTPPLAPVRVDGSAFARMGRVTARFALDAARGDTQSPLWRNSR